MKQSWLVLLSSLGSGLGYGSGAPVLVFVVRGRFLNYCFKWPFVVAGESGRCLERRSSVSPVQVVRWPFLIAWMNVEGAGLKNAAWKNWPNYFWSCSYAQYNWLPILVDELVSVGCPIYHLVCCACLLEWCFHFFPTLEEIFVKNGLKVIII